MHAETPRSLALLTDLYELTMAAAAWRSGVAGDEAVFTLSFRKNPFDGGFAVAAGLGPGVDFLTRVRFQGDDLAWLAQLRDDRGGALFEQGFLDWLSRLSFAVDVDAVPEGTVVFPWEPLLRVQGPVVPCMLLETALLTFVNFQTLIATKAARVKLAARGDPVLEFGLRRAQGLDGGLSASRAAFLGGCDATSNALAAKLHGIPARGTHAHSWVMLFDSEQEAFERYAEAMPHNCVLLVDTWDSLDGVRHAIAAGEALRARGAALAGIRLDSGDLAWLSQEARRMLDAAGLEKARIYASNDLDERVIESLKEQGARIDVWGVGTRLVTGAPDAALGGVYKLGAQRRPGAAWLHRVKRAEGSGKTSVPGILQVRRYEDGGAFLADCIHDTLLGLPSEVRIVDPTDHARRRAIPGGLAGRDLLEPVVRGGVRCAPEPPLAGSRRRTLEELGRLHQGVKRLVNPHRYPAGLERGLFDLRTRLALEGGGG